MYLYLIRHAESNNNARPEHERVEDPEITERGVEQAAMLADWLATCPLDLVITSPFRRALQTVVPIAATSNPNVEVWCDVFERGGCYSGWQASNECGAMGLNRREILELVPSAEVDAELSTNGWWGGRPREADCDAQARAEAVREKLETRFGNTQHRIALVTHAEFQRLLLGEMLTEQGLDVTKFGPICNAGVTCLNFDQYGWRLQWLNSVTHITSHLITGAKG